MTRKIFGPFKIHEMYNEVFSVNIKTEKSQSAKSKSSSRTDPRTPVSSVQKFEM